MHLFQISSRKVADAGKILGQIKTFTTSFLSVHRRSDAHDCVTTTRKKRVFFNNSFFSDKNYELSMRTEHRGFEYRKIREIRIIFLTTCLETKLLREFTHQILNENQSIFISKIFLFFFSENIGWSFEKGFWLFFLPLKFCDPCR